MLDFKCVFCQARNQNTNKCYKDIILGFRDAIEKECTDVSENCTYDYKGKAREMDEIIIELMTDSANKGRVG